MINHDKLLKHDLIVYSNLKSNINSKKENKKKLKIINNEFDKIKEEWNSIKNKEISIISKDDLKSNINFNKSIVSRNISVNSNNYRNERQKNKMIKQGTNVYDNLNNDSSSFSSDKSNNFNKINKIYFCNSKKKMKSCKKIVLKNNNNKEHLMLKNVYSKLNKKIFNIIKKNSDIDETTQISENKIKIKKLNIKQKNERWIYNKAYFNKTKYTKNNIRFLNFKGNNPLKKKKSFKLTYKLTNSIKNINNIN